MGNSEWRENWAPDRDSQNCSHCSAPFSVTRRKHHCRKCGMIFCQNCSFFRSPVSEYKDFTPMCSVPSSSGPTPDQVRRRVCKSCFESIARETKNYETANEEYYWNQAQEDLEGIQYIIQQINGYHYEETNAIPISKTQSEDSHDSNMSAWGNGYDSLSSISGISSASAFRGMTGTHAKTEDTVTGIKKRFGDMRLQANQKKEEFTRDYNQLSELYIKKDRERFTKEVRILKKKVVLEYERLKGDDGFWVLADADKTTVDATIRDMKVLIKEQIQEGHFKPTEWDPKWEKQYDILLEQLKGSLEVKDREGFIVAIKHAKLRIEEDTSKIMSRTYSDWESASDIGVSLYK